MTELIRCGWVNLAEPLYMSYHDEEWGIPCHQDQKLFEMLVLEGAQAGLSWITVLKKRAAYREAFDNFDPVKVARYDDAKIAELMANPGIIRNRLKLNAAIQNARSFLAVQQEFGSFDRYIWGFVGGSPKVNAWKSLKEVPPETAESQAMSKDLLKRGFKFVGPTICYAFMQATGMVNDHTVDCFRHNHT
jgi:DNA-3-methyladenine glycosylase I